MERDGRELRVGADRPCDHELGRRVEPRLLEDVRAHHQVGVPVPAGVRAVRADPADLCREVEHELRVGVVEQALRVLHRREVVVTAASDRHLVAFFAEELREPRPRKPPPPVMSTRTPER